MIQEKTEIEEIDWDFIDYTGHFESDWKINLRALLSKNENEWLGIFPEAKEVISEKIREWNDIANENRIVIRKALKIIEEKSSGENKSFWRDVLKYAFQPVRELALANKNIKRLKFLIPQHKNKKTGYIWKDIFEKAKSRDIHSVAEYYDLHLTKSGKSYKGLCPLHNEKTPSFHIYPPDHFICFGCNAKGDVITLVKLLEKCSFKEAVHKLQNI